LIIEINSILNQIGVIETRGDLPAQVSGITQDSRLVQPGYIFAARSGSTVCGVDFIPAAADRGAIIVITDEILPDICPLPSVRVTDFRQALVRLSKAVYGDPSACLNLIGVTGTNGKTTSVHLIRSILEAAGERCGLISTVGYDTGQRHLDAPLTTPDIDRLCELLREMVDAGCLWAVMEVSSHALVQGRVEGLNFNAAGFTNLTRDHLDFHGSLEAYAAAKAKLFNMMDPDGAAVINIGDPWGKAMVEAACGTVTTYGMEGAGGDLTVTSLEHSLDGGQFRLDWSGGSAKVLTSLIGDYHGENIALAAGVALGFGIDIGDILRGVEALKIIPGRMEAVSVGQPFAVLVDYSHTPDALERALSSLRPLCRGSIIVVFGCGGDRDRSKRPEMGRVASRSADRVIVTSDNPRSEDPKAIAADIARGRTSGPGSSTEVELDRRAAIHKALSIADEGDAVLIAGKGHETYQEIQGIRRSFDDRMVASEELARLGW